MLRFWRRIRERPATAFGRPAPGRWGFELQGSVELRTSTFVRGWIRDAAHPSDRLRVIARTNGRVLAAGTADLFRPDLEAAGIGDGRYAFELHFPEMPGAFSSGRDCRHPPNRARRALCDRGRDAGPAGERRLALPPDWFKSSREVFHRATTFHGCRGRTMVRPFGLSEEAITTDGRRLFSYDRAGQNHGL